MKHIKTITSLAFFLLGVVGLHAQESLNATGGDATGSGGTLAYSVGQVVYTTNTDASGTLSQGVQQAYEIFTLGVEETELNISISIFPNPTADNLTLQISEYNNEKLSYQLFDMRGKLLNNGQVNAQQTQIETASLPSATYLINVVFQENFSAGRHGKQINSFKIIKN